MHSDALAAARLLNCIMDNQHNLYREQIEQLRDYALFFMDVNGIIKTWNAGVEHLLGYSESEWVNQHTSIIFTPADAAVELCEAEMRIARDQGTASDIRWHRKKDGTELFAHGVISRVVDASGRLQGFTKVISDETARKHLDDSLLAANTALEHFAYAASHDLQEPLRTIGLYAELLARQHGEQLGATGAKYLEFISGSVGRMRTLVDDLLGYARAGVVNEAPVAASLDDDMEAAASQLTGAIEETGAVVTHDPLPTITAEHSQVTRLFLNLIGNAIKYRSPDRKPEIHVTASPQGEDSVIVSVKDNGIGFAPEYADKIFNPFKRLHGKEYSGSGVGLAICRRIVERCGGRIWAESSPGEGSVFYFMLPRSQDSE